MEKEFEVCFSFLDNQENYYFFSQKTKTFFKRCLGKMKEEIEKMQKEEQTTFDSKSVLRGLTAISDLIIFNLKEEKFVDFCKAFATIAFNWNRNGLKLEKIEELAIKIDYIGSCFFKISDVISYIRDISNKLFELEKIEPPSFRLSKHYFDLLKE
jgi:hypothetical protein